ncbi:MAG: universal stress protein [Deltaproteobacteria bacterium]|nr:universal stress protein [Deltaproteobacteria bacterium]
MNTKKMLFATKFNELRFDALQSLLNLRKASYNHVVFLTAIETQKVAMHRGIGYQKREEVKLKEKANIRFIDWAETLFEQGMEVGVYIVIGSFIGQLVKAAKKEEADLIVMGRTRKKRFEQFYSGSDITEIIKRTLIPILIYSKPQKDRGANVDFKPFDRPILAVDWSPVCQEAVEYLKGLSDVVQRVEIVHVADENELKGSSAMGIQKTRKEVMKKLEKICDELESVGIDSRPHVYIGDKNAEIEKAAIECQATMIIAGAHKNAWKERLIGSIPKKLAEKSTFPVLLISAGPKKE